MQEDRSSGLPGTPAGLVVIVTGATGEIGAAYAAALARSGADVLATDLPATRDAGEALAAKITADGHGRAAFVAGDVTDDADLAEVVRTARERFGGVDALVNNAALYQAIGSKQPITELTNADWDRVLTVNVRGTWQAIKAAVPAMRERGGGRVVNIASTVARSGASGFAHYVASKAAVEGLTRAAARELGQYGITVNAVAPGLVDDEASRTLNSGQYLTQAAGGRSISRDMRPDDLIGAVLWLCSPSSGFVSGQTLIVDGGQVFG